ncbi:unnamed protein product [Rhizoctonia solani]|uniref:Ricin B lectin domain-containing protein n=1 Tax=Rhizoctonia solani TaxID=456999 RepID=A0A8H3E6W1_9AGAM|nr:unnamed protein product [Rhizoctonia solani]
MGIAAAGRLLLVRELTINKPGQDRVLALHRGKATNGNKVPRFIWSLMLSTHLLTVLLVGSTDIQSRVYASSFPTTWELLQQGDYYFINKPGQDRVLDLHWGEATNGNKIHIRPRDGHPCKHWKFEYLEGDTQRFIHEQFGLDSKEGRYLRTIATLRKEIQGVQRDVSEKNTQLSDCRDDLRRLRNRNEDDFPDMCPGMDMPTYCDQCTFHKTNIYNL